MAIYSGPRSSYTITFNAPAGGHVLVADSVATRDGTDDLANVEVLQFSDGIYLISSGTALDPVNLPALRPGSALGPVTSLTSNADDFILVDGGFNGVSINLGGGTGDTVSLAFSGGYTLNLFGVENAKGSSGDDFVVLQNNADGLAVDLGGGSDTVMLAHGSNTLSVVNTENIYASDFDGAAFNDTLTLLNNLTNINGVTINLAQGTNNTLNLAAGVNILVDAFGVQTINGTASSDTLSFLNGTFGHVVHLGAGDDSLTLSAPSFQVTFVYGDGDGADSFAGIDGASGNRVDLTGVTGVHSLADVMSRATQSGADTIITFGPGNSLTLQNVAPGDLVENDFIFDANHAATIGGKTTGNVVEDDTTVPSGGQLPHDMDAGTLTVADVDPG
jgi:hypothetical protein